MSYHATVRDVYRAAAEAPDAALCCVPQTPKYLPGLSIPRIMHEMNYGCGTTLHLQDMAADQTILYVGVGGGLEALQLAYFARRPGGVVAVDPVAEMREAARRNLELAAASNPWFDPAFVEIRDGDALDLPVDDASVHVAAQNCLFNMFKVAEPGEADGDLERALREMHRVLRPAGRLVMSDPIAPRPMPSHLQDDAVLRAQCLSGCLTYDDYIGRITDAGFGSVEVRSRRPYRLLDRTRYDLEEDLLLDTLEVAAYKVDVPADGPCVFTGRVAIYAGPDDRFDDGRGHLLLRDVPLPVCDKTATALARLDHAGIHAGIMVTEPTWHYAGGGCC